MRPIKALLLLPAWGVHDAEEWLTTESFLLRLAERYPWLPLPSAQRERLAILNMGAIIGLGF